MTNPDDTFLPDETVFLNAKDVLTILDQRIEAGYRELREDPADPDDPDHVQDNAWLAEQTATYEKMRRLLAASCQGWEESPIRVCEVL